MIVISKTYITPEMTIEHIVSDSPILLLVLENFGIHTYNKTYSVSQLCTENNIDTQVFINICNLHNGFFSNNTQQFTISQIPNIIRYLRGGHTYYLSEKYPEIKEMLELVKTHSTATIIPILDTYFSEYFEEVKTHIAYEETTVFPYFLQTPNAPTNYSGNTYKEHHSDIEESLQAFRNMIVEHVQIPTHPSIKRKLLLSIAELEFELKIHSHIENTILTPLAKKL